MQLCCTTCVFMGSNPQWNCTTGCTALFVVMSTALYQWQSRLFLSSSLLINTLAFHKLYTGSKHWTIHSGRKLNDGGIIK